MKSRNHSFSTFKASKLQSSIVIAFNVKLGLLLMIGEEFQLKHQSSCLVEFFGCIAFCNKKAHQIHKRRIL